MSFAYAVGVPRRLAIVRVAIALDRSNPSTTALFDGVLEIARVRGWRLGDETTIDAADGVIRQDNSTAGRSKTVTVSTDPRSASDVLPDAFAVGRLAAEHFLDRGFRAFVFVGPDGEHYDGFAATARPAGGVCSRNEDARAALDRPGPLACAATDDTTAAAVLVAMRAAGRSVPTDSAVLGVGNDAMACELVSPPLSSIDVGPRQIGRRAAERLHRLLAGRDVPSVDRVPPLGVVVRASTDTLAIDDPDVAAAVRFIREHATGPLRVGDVLRAVDLDRRTLERRFRKALGRSPAEVLRRHRVELAAGLLRSTARPVSEIATAIGFRLPQHLAAAFRQLRGQTPSEYRASVNGVRFD